MNFRYEVEDEYIIPEKRIDNRNYIDERVNAVKDEHKGSFRSILKYLYLTDGPQNVDSKRYKISKQYLERGELVLINWLKTRTNGKLRKDYGLKILKAVREAKYRCLRCSFPDVRTLQLDHIDGRTGDTEFDCLCANCHQIKTRATQQNKHVSSQHGVSKTAA
jgi:hypothetical protein